MAEKPHPPRRQNARAGLWVALGASLLLHLALVGVVDRLPPAPPPAPARREPITITFQRAPPVRAPAVTTDHPDDVAAPAQTRRPPAREQKPKDEPRPDGQVVRLPAPTTIEKPDEARYLSEFDRKVERETRANRTSNKAPPAETFIDEENEAAEKKADESEAAAPAGDDDDDTPSDQQALRLRMPGSQDDLYAGGGLMEMWRAAERSQRGDVAGAPGQDDEERPGADAPDDGEGGAGHAEAPGEGEGPSGPVDLALSPAAASRIAGGAPANDAIDDVPEGGGTMLNSRQWKYAAFFNRVSDAIRRHWNPNDALRRKRDDPALRRASKRVTTVEMTLDRQGRVVRVTIERYSGLLELDEEATRAARAAGPFPHPPPGLFDEGKDEFSFRFGFHFTFERGRLDLFAPGAFGP